MVVGTQRFGSPREKESGMLSVEEHFHIAKYGSVLLGNSGG